MNEQEEREIIEAAGISAEDPKVEAAIFGREVEDFIDNHPVGKYLIERAREDIESAKDALIEVDPQDTMKVVEIQNRAKTAQNVRQWLREAINAGRNAEAVLTQERDINGTN